VSRPVLIVVDEDGDSLARIEAEPLPLVVSPNGEVMANLFESERTA
jgi:hypothetical protein